MKDSKVILTDVDLQGRVLPQAIEEETAVLGAMVLEQNAALLVINVLHELMFYKEQHQKIYKAIKEVFNSCEPIDMLSVTNRLRKNGDLEFVGGAYYIASLTNHVVSSANIEYYASVVKERYIQRKLISVATEIIHNSYSPITEYTELLNITQKNLYSVLNESASNSNAVNSIGDIANICIQNLSKRKENFENDILNGIPTGSRQLDKMTGGLQTGLVFLAGRPGSKKTATALNIARMCSQNGYKAAFFSLEMTNTSLVDRLIIANSGLEIETVRYRSGNVSKEETELLITSAIELKELDMYIDDESNVNMFYIGAKLRLLVSQGKCDIAFIDYLQLVDTDKGYGKSREREISEVTRYLKLLSKELNIPIIVLAQLSREVEKRGGNGVPQLSDLRESGNIENDADLVIFTYRPEYYGVESIKIGNEDVSSENILILMIAKQREGNIGNAYLFSQNNAYNLVDYFDRNRDIISEYNRTPIDRYDPINKEDSPF